MAGAVVVDGFEEERGVAFDLEEPAAAYESADYKKALAALGSGVERDWSEDGSP